MPQSLVSTATVRILAVVVLYKCKPSGSRSLSALAEILRENPGLARHFSLIIYDNSPDEQALDIALAIRVLYRHDGSNPGLAVAYNFALTQAEEQGCEWLLLLDQDTQLTTGFLNELIASTEHLRADGSVASIAPKLLVDGEQGRICSPAPHFLDQLRRQFSRSKNTVNASMYGAQEERLSAYNSGAALRISALRIVGGFPPEYWLDYLDHAIFHALSARGYRTYVLHSELQHEASQRTYRDVPLWRQRNLINSQIRFVSQTGNWLDRFLFRIWLLRYSRIMARDYPDPRLWKEVVWQAIVLRGLPGTRPG